MPLLIGAGKPFADFTKIQSIAIAPKDMAITGVWVSKTGRILHEAVVMWSGPLSTDDDDCPINAVDFEGWTDGTYCLQYPSHWIPIS